MSISPERLERYCLGGLMKDIEKDLSADELDNISNDGTAYKSSQDRIFSSNDTPFTYTTFFSPSLENYNIFSKSKINEDGDNSEDEKEKEKQSKYSLKSILAAFNSQKSTKQLQNDINKESKENITIIIKELKGNFRTIIKNINGNYFCSDLIRVCNNEQRIEILKELSPFLSEDCVQEFATHSIQQLIASSSSEEEYKLLLASFNDVNKIILPCLNQNGSFVIQKLIGYIPEKIREEFNSIFVKFIVILSKDMHGLCCVKKFIAYTKNELHMKQIFNLIISNFINISSNQYGNYLIQYLLEKWWDTADGQRLKILIASKFQILSGNHYSSYICRSFFKLCSNKEKKEKKINNKDDKGTKKENKVNDVNKRKKD